MKLVASLFVAGFICTGAWAWDLDFQDGTGHEWKTHGTADVDCNHLNKDWWGKYKTKNIFFDPATDWHTDPTKVTVYEGEDCDGANWGVKKGANTLSPAKRIKSYRLH
ncbi:hypothetical protein GQ53DRAFT_760100 [Thozetella sp. PMI_491]|nr:hypothetical protein GQ53DRAFT_760100 [Thozetella sp. PMI_491]